MPGGTSALSTAWPASSRTSGCARSPARCTATRVWAVTSSAPLKTRSSSASCGSCAGVPSSVSAKSSPPPMPGILMLDSNWHARNLHACGRRRMHVMSAAVVSEPGEGRAMPRPNAPPGAIVGAGMEVYLVPVGDELYELYCEVPDEPEVPPDLDAPAGFLARMRRRFSVMLAEAERERRQGSSVPHDAGWMARAKSRTMRWVAESIAEQRLLWHLRRQTDACLFYPDDLSEPEATRRLRAQLGRDRDRH